MLIDFLAKRRQRGAKAPFSSLVERSITAWQSMEYQGKDDKYRQSDAIQVHSKILMSYKNLEQLLMADTHQFWFFQLRESFIGQKLFQQWDSTNLDNYILIPAGDGFPNQLDCIFISHYWHSPSHPDPNGDDLRSVQERLREGFWSHVSYFWIDWTCMPQSNRTETQQKYFKISLKMIPSLIWDCIFLWQLPKFEPRLWILFEIAAYTLTRSRPFSLSDTTRFVAHLSEVNKEGVRLVLIKHGYRCTNQSDSELVIMWLEILLILYKLTRSVRVRREVLNAIDNPMTHTCVHKETGIFVDKRLGIVKHNGEKYEFTPMPFAELGKYNSTKHVDIKETFSVELSNALSMAEESGAYIDLERQYDREGEYQISEQLLRRAVAVQHRSLSGGTAALYLLAENLEKQTRYEEAIQLYSRILDILPSGQDFDSKATRGTTSQLRALLQKLDLRASFERWKEESLEGVLGTNLLELLADANVSPDPGASGARMPIRAPRVLTTFDDFISQDKEATKLERDEKFGEALEIRWNIASQIKGFLGPYNLHTRGAICELANLLRRRRNTAAAEKLYWLALALSDGILGTEHKYTLAILNNLAITMGVLRNGEGEKEMLRQLLERWLKVRDLNHSDVFSAKHNLSTCLGPDETVEISINSNILGERSAKVTIGRTLRK